jgi:hypothetical protein
VPEHDDELIARIATELRVTPPLSETFDARVMAEVASLPPHPAGRLAAAARWWRRPRTLRVSPLGGLALAAGLVTLLVWRGTTSRPATGRPAVSESAAAAPGVLLARHGATLVQFVLVAPDARRVALVGDFNDWDPAATPLRASAGGAWSAAVQLTPGRHRYAFVVDGDRWLADPAAPPAPDDDFGSPGSVVTVGA